MREKISIFVLSTAGSPVKQITASKTFIRFFGCFLAVCIAISVYVLYDYTNLKIHNIEGKYIQQQSEIQNQRKQIQEFAEEITSLKTKVLALNKFENQIRFIANIEKSDESEELFGVGGSIPEDLDTRVPLTAKHNSLLREMHEQVRQLHQASTIQNENLDSLYNHFKEQRNLLASTPAIRPIRASEKTKGTYWWPTSKFGYRKSRFTGLREFHKGYDVATKAGTPIISTANGVVTYAAPKGNLGNLMIVDHGHGLMTSYAHCDKVLKKSGEKVKRGDTIALVGDSGRSTGPHVHYEVHLNGVPVNPEKYILN
ncbi:MAG: M23 family metallopeptidase [Desulfobacterales bacterium]|nr:M23 family metallopeptidase [Desulfobacterales bacterium]